MNKTEELFEKLGGEYIDFFKACETGILHSYDCNVAVNAGKRGELFTENVFCESILKRVYKWIDHYKILNDWKNYKLPTGFDFEDRWMMTANYCDGILNAYAVGVAIMNRIKYLNPFYPLDDELDKWDNMFEKIFKDML